jgi:hypothetical protein
VCLHHVRDASVCELWACSDGIRCAPQDDGPVDVAATRRVLPWVGLSSPLFIAVLTHFSYGQEHYCRLRIDEERGQCGRVLSWIIQLIQDTDFSIPIRLDEGVVRLQNGTVAGSNPIVLHCKSGVVVSMILCTVHARAFLEFSGNSRVAKIRICFCSRNLPPQPCFQR